MEVSSMTLMSIIA